MTQSTENQLLALRHSAEHVLTQALIKLYGQDKIINSLKPFFDSPKVQLLEPPLAESYHAYIDAFKQIIGQPTTAVDFASDARFWGATNTPAIIFGPTGKGMHGTG